MILDGMGRRGLEKVEPKRRETPRLEWQGRLGAACRTRTKGPSA
jgi:hypothetical protein